MHTNMTTVTTEIMGGLGNQLFQIFNLVAYSFQHKTRFYFSGEPITQGQRKTTYWDTFFLQALKTFVKAPHPAAQQHQAEQHPAQQEQPLIYHERNFHYEPIPSPPPPKHSLKFFGYFQSYKYFQEQQDLIYKFIRLRETQAIFREKNRENYDYDYANTVALHFRVGDYKNLPNHHPLMTLEYYTAALKQLRQDMTTFTMTVLYFCEQADQDYIQEKMLHPLQQNPLFQNRFTFKCIDHNLSDWEQLIVMSLCQHHIIANSTFSWWGAYLGLGGNPANPTTPVTEIRSTSDGQSHHVYYPTTWFGSAMGYKNLADLFPPHWHRIQV